jgi:hypothetical protein
MFGRVRRAAATLPGEDGVRSYAVLHVYSPEVIASVLAAGMGAAGVASGSAMARTADGRQVSALAEAVTGAMDWGRREQRRYVKLPGRVLVLAASNAVIVREWTLAKGMGRELARWPVDSFSATKVRYIGQVGVRVVLASGKVAILTGRRGSLHPHVRTTIEAMIAVGEQGNS